MSSRVLTSLDDIYAHLLKRSPSQQASSPVSVVCDADEKPAFLAYDSHDTSPPPRIDESRACAWFIVSTSALDRHSDRVLPSSFIPWMPHFEKNPRGFFSHNQHDKPIGSWRDPETGLCTVEIFDDHILAGIFFHLKTEESREVWELVKAHELEAVSVGFLPHKAILLDNDPDYCEGVSDLLPGDELDFDRLSHGLEFTEAELLEISVVPIPANREALSRRLAKGLLKTSSLRKVAALPKKVWSSGVTVKVEPSVKEVSTLMSPPFNYSLEQVKALTLTDVRNLIGKPSRASENTKIAPIGQSPPVDEIRWNKSLSRKWDISEQRLRPATLEYDFASKHLGCKVKEIHEHSIAIPSAKIGSFLSGWRDAIAHYSILDVRNITYDGREAPPVHEKIQLNSKLSDDFLIEGLEFLEDVATQQRIVVARRPVWWGLLLTIYAKREEREIALRLPEYAWELAATTYNFLKGEAFSLSGEFLPRTSDSWDGLFLPEKNEDAIKRTLIEINAKQAAFANRGTILMGPPGTGKTLSGRVIRNEAQTTFIWISARDFHRSGSFGGFAYAFDLAKELAPSVLFFEDIDNWMSQHSTDLLKTEMDGVERYSGVWTLLSTNFPEKLPEALIDRPGRFHDVLLFNLPDDDVRRKMFNAWLPGLDEDTLVSAVADTVAQSGAHIYELCRFAKSLCDSDGTPLVEALEKAITKTKEQRALIGTTQNPFRDNERDWAKSFSVRSAGRYLPRIVSKGVIPYSKHPLAPEDTTWDASKERKAAEVDDLKKMCAWYKDPGDSKGDYSLPHHTANGYKTVWNGVRAAMGALLGARGGLTDVSESDRKKIHAHIKSHYLEFQRKAPELKVIDEAATIIAELTVRYPVAVET